MTDRARIKSWRIPHRGIQYAEDSFTWRVNDPDALGVAIKSIDQHCEGKALFRGHRNANWPLHSKYRRSMEGICKPPSFECTTENVSEWNEWHFRLVNEYVNRFEKLQNRCAALSAICDQHGADLHFEFHKASQQYADLVPEGALSCGSNLVDFSKSFEVGLFFSAYDPLAEDLDKPASIVVIDPTILNHIEQRLTDSCGASLILEEFREDLTERVPKADFPLYRVERAIPCARTEVQQACYLAQMDFRHCATVLWHLASEKMGRQHFCKIEYPAHLKAGVLAYCAAQGVDAETMFPLDRFWQEKIEQIRIKL